MSKLNQWLTLVANVSVVAGIVFLAVEMRLNTDAIQAQTRDSITEKQMEFSSWVATNRDLAEVFIQGSTPGQSELDPVDQTMFGFFTHGLFREYENSLYQYERGLFTADEFEARVERWRQSMANPGYRNYWARQREIFSPSFRAEIDRIVAEVEQAQ
jgi:hypothetical protein